MATVETASDSRAGRAGGGFIEVRLGGERSRVTRLEASYPLKFLTPQVGSAAWVIVTGYGGGLLAGDQMNIALKVGDGAAALLGTQASTKIYRRPAADSPAVKQTLRAEVGDGALLAVVPDPVTLFAGALYEQEQEIQLAPRGSLLLIDWQTSGRMARGERWASDGYTSRIDVRRGEEHVLRDALCLRPEDGPLASENRMGRFNCIATVVVCGPRLKELAAAVLAAVAAEPLSRGAELIQAASELPGGGALLRVAGVATEQVGALLRRRLTVIVTQLGDDPWQRKW
jgi:urease accessory protein